MIRYGSTNFLFCLFSRNQCLGNTFFFRCFCSAGPFVRRMDARERNDNKNVSFLFLSDSRCPAYTVMLCQEHPQKQTSSFFLFGSNFATRRANELSPTRRLVKRKRDLLEGRIAPHSLHHFFLLLLRISVSGITHTQISIFLFVFRWFSPNKQKGGTL